MKNWMSIVVIFALGLGACTAKKRDEALPYGADKDLLTIADYAGKEFTIQTQGVLSTSQDKKSLKLNAEKSKAKLRAFDFVKYDAANDKLNLLDKSLILGKTNHQYRMKYEFEGTLLKVYKVGSAEELSAQELATAQDIPGKSKTEKKVPVVAYKVSYFTLENQRNEKDETTHTLKLTGQDSAALSTNFKIDYNSKSMAKFLPKDLVFESSIFDGEWYYAKTTASQNYLRKEMNGWMASEDDEGIKSSKVLSQKRETAIDFINTNVDDRIKANLTDRKENQNIALSIPAEFIDYRMSPEGRSTGINEEAYTEGAWDQRKYVKLKLETDTSELLDIQFDDGYISFLTFDRNAKIKTRTALYNVKEYRKKNPAYTPKVYLKEDKNVFGFFYETKNTLKTGDLFRREDFQNDNLIDRYNPLLEKIVFSVNVGAPDWSVDLAQRAVDAWDQAFKQAGIQTKLELSKERAEVGDLRANVINMIGDVDGNEPYWGVAPKVVDNQTGEIISSTANINLMSIIYRGDALVEQYLRARGKKLEKNYVLGIPLPSSDLFGETSEETPAATQVPTENVHLDKVQFSGADSKTGKVLRKAFSFDASKIKSKMNRVGSLTAFHSEATFEDVNENIIPELERLCPDVKAMGDQVAKGSNLDKTTDEFKKIRRACSMEVSKVKIISTLIHEMGHNFGLRHNFRGSTDWRNFFPGVNDWTSIVDTATGKLNLPAGVSLGAPVKMNRGNGQEMTYYIRSSSVMEYTNYNHDTMIIPGPYDVAALRWAYTGQVLDTSDKLVKVKDEEPLAKQVGQTMRHFAYCTDEDIDYYGRDSMCIREDQGLTASAIVEAAKARFNSYISNSFQKLDRNQLSFGNKEQAKQFEILVSPMLRIYQDWRSMVAAEVGYSEAYLEKLNKEQYAAIVTQITTVNDSMKPSEKAYRIRLADYHNAADNVFLFLMNIAFHPDYTCFVNKHTNKQDDFALMAFANIQRDIHAISGITATTCKDQVVTNYIRSQYGQEAVVIGAGGLSTNDLRYNLDPTAFEDGPDRLGLLNNKVFALEALVSRKPYFFKTVANDLLPNFLDEPQYRDAFTSLVTERLQSGVDISIFGINSSVPIVSPIFENEKDFLVFMYSQLKEGLMIPGKLEVTNKRLEAFTVLPSYYRSYSDRSQVRCASLQGIDYCAGPENMVSRSLLESLGRIQTMRTAKLPSLEALKLFVEILNPLIPAVANEKTAFSGADFMKILGSLEAAATKLKSEKKDELATDLQTITTGLLLNEIKVINSSLKRRLSKADEESLSDTEYLQKRVEILKLDVVKLAKETVGSDQKPLSFNLGMDVIKERIKTMGASIIKLQRSYEQNKTELEAQAEVLMQAIFTR